jgi:hypothetical protein
MVKQAVLLILCVFALIFSGCQKVEEGRQDIQKAKDVKGLVESKMKDVQKSEKELLEKNENKFGEPEKRSDSK